jgi:hypothetical protein
MASDAGMVRVNVCLDDDVVVAVQHVRWRGVRGEHAQVLLDRERDVAEASDVAHHNELLRPRDQPKGVRADETRRAELTNVPVVRADVAAEPSGRVL